MLWSTPQASVTLQLTVMPQPQLTGLVMANTAGSKLTVMANTAFSSIVLLWPTPHALIECYGQHRAGNLAVRSYCFGEVRGDQTQERIEPGQWRALIWLLCMANTASQLHALICLLWSTTQARCTLLLAVMANTTGLLCALIDYQGQHRLPVAQCLLT